MRVLGLALAGVVALTAPIIAHAGPLVGTRAVAPAGPPSVIVQIWDRRGSGGHPAASDYGGNWAFGPRVDAVNPGWRPPYWRPNGFNGVSGFYRGPAAPSYWVYVPGSAVFDDPFPDWRGPTGGWGNP
jgi:hypothetical protein